MPERTKHTQQSLSRTARRQQTKERRLQIAAIVLMVGGILIGLSIVFYSPLDEAPLEHVTLLDVLRLPFDESVKAIAVQIQNNLGLLGALVSNFFINKTVGYASIIVAILCIVWGWFVLRKKELAKLATLTNYSIIVALLFSTAAGLSNLVIGGVDKSWSGIVGAFLSDVLVNLFGEIGSAIVVCAALFITLVLAIDLDIHKTLERLSALWQSLTAKPEVQEEEVIRQEAEKSEVVIKKTEETNEDEEEIQPQRTPSIMKPPEASNRGEGRTREVLTIDIREPIGNEQGEAKHEQETPPPAESEEKEIDYVFPSVELLDALHQTEALDEEELKANAELLKAKLANFGVDIDKVSVVPGPVITLYELVPAEGVKISRIVNLENDLALALAAKGIRIMAPIPGKSAVGVEIPNKHPVIVSLRSVINSTKFRETRAHLPVALGKTINGEVYTDDLTKMPHLLLAGSTGSGKSVGINTLLASLLFRLHPSEVKFIIIDPKKIELRAYARLKHHFLAVSPDIQEEIITTPENAVAVLRSVETEMEKRYDRLAAAGVRNIQDYNERLTSGRLKHSETVVHRKMPYLVVVIDELADLMITAAREVEEPIARLAQLARAVGIHLVLATQRPSVDVITGVIKANFPARIAYQVASKTDSRTILDMNGAEQLLGSGDMLYLPAGSPKPIRIQNAFISSDEVERLTEHIAKQQGYSKPFLLPSLVEKKGSRLSGTSGTRDEFFEEAAKLVVRHQQGSVSLVQRRLKVGYSRAARIIDELEAAGIVGPFDGSKAREVLIEDEAQLNQLLDSLP
jgi:S-DNA-T family DNA segregation ATPase FtsK/SpoIIIE